jgi:hypothetical protein
MRCLRVTIIDSHRNPDCGQSLVETALAKQRNPPVDERLGWPPEGKPGQYDETLIENIAMPPSRASCPYRI